MVDDNIEIRSAVPQDSREIARLWLDGLQFRLDFRGLLKGSYRVI